MRKSKRKRDEIRNRILIAAFQVNLLLFILSVCFLDSGGYRAFLIATITGLFLAWFLMINLGIYEDIKEGFKYENHKAVR